MAAIPLTSAELARQQSLHLSTGVALAKGLNLLTFGQKPSVSEEELTKAIFEMINGTYKPPTAKDTVKSQVVWIIITRLL